MSGNGDDLRSYVFQGNRGEKVPAIVEKLIINQGIRKLPTMFCFNCKLLREVTLPNGLTKIGTFAFHLCENLLEITICNTVQCIGMAAFKGCLLLTKVEFEVSSTTLSVPTHHHHHHHELGTIEHQAFRFCSALSRVRLPPSVDDSVGGYAFANCNALVEADLSKTAITEISKLAFAQCRSLQTVSLPNSLERICDETFFQCGDLVTVIMPLAGAQPIQIGHQSFDNCDSLANFLLPKDSIVEEHSFTDCIVLEKRYGGESASIAVGLVGRFDDFPVHRLCYDHATTTPEELQECIEEQEKESSLVDEFGMTAFHVLFSTIGPSAVLLQVLLNEFPFHLLGRKDANGKRAMDYLIKNWTNATPTLIQMSLQKWMIDRINRWGTASWKEAIQSKVHSILFEACDQGQRATLWTELHSSFAHYEIVESTSIFELALWKTKLSSGRTRFSTKRQARDRGECRCVSGSDVVIPHVLKFLDVA